MKEPLSLLAQVDGMANNARTCLPYIYQGSFGLAPDDDVHGGLNIVISFKGIENFLCTGQFKKSVGGDWC